jgi:phosphomannomutase
VGRDLLAETLRALGAVVVEIARSDVFIPVDTEAVSDADRAFLHGCARGAGLDAIVSTDGDGDRPLVTDATGAVVPGDVLGQITAQLLGAEVVVTPVSSNTGAEAGYAFERVVRTKIGSPYVIAAMEAEGGRVVGYEANGGFLLGFDAMGPAGPLPALMTRDSHLPIIGALVASGSAGLAARVAAEPARFTAGNRLQEVPTERSAALVAALTADTGARDGFLAALGQRPAVSVDTTDGLRLTLAEGRVVHLRPSGNAPELRFYAEAETAEAAQGLLDAGLAELRRRVDG